MDVRCENCQTVYEFDDARVKEGGVTVKCTQCGHIFKVRKRPSGVRQPRTLPGIAPLSDSPPPAAPAPAAATPPPAAPVPRPVAPESTGAGEGKLWLLRSQAGGEVRRFRDLTTLQQWIVEKKAFRDDEISRTGDRWKRIGGIAELTPFFRIVEQAEARARNPTPPPPVNSPVAYSNTVPQPILPKPSLAAGGMELPTAAAFPDPTPTATMPVVPSSGAPGSFADGYPGRLSSDTDGGGDLDEIPRRRVSGSSLLAIGTVLLLVAGAGYLALFKRTALQSIVAGEEGSRGREAYRKGLEYFLLDTDDDFHRADQQLQRAQGADEANPLPVAALVEVNVTWARWLREDARSVEHTQPGRADELRKEAQARLDDARRFANEAHALAPADPDVNRAMADFLVLDGAPAAQVEDYIKKAEARRPDDAELRYVRAALALRDGRPDDARSLLEQANKLSQQKTQHDLLRADYLLASILATAGKREDARAAAQRILETNPHHRRAAELIGRLDAPPVVAAPPAAVAAPSVQGADAGVAVAPAAAVAQAVPAAARPTDARPAEARPTDGKPGEPRAGEGETAKAEPHGYEALVTAGDKLLERGKGREAVKLFEKALAEQPDGIEAENGLAYAYLDTEHFNAAADQFRKVLAAVPSNGDAIIGLAETYKSRGDKAHALEWYKKYVSELPGGSKAAMAKKNVEDLEMEARQAPHATATEIHEAPPLPHLPSPETPPP